MIYSYLAFFLLISSQMLVSSAEEEYAIEETDSDFDDGQTDIAYVRERRDLAAAESGIGGTGGGAGAGYKAGKVNKH